MNLPAAFAEIGLGFSSLIGGPYWPARVIEQIAPVYGDGGSIVMPGGVSYRACQAQIDTATQRMREAEGYVETDAAFIVLTDTLEGTLNTEARIQITEGPHAGIWSVELIERDTAAAGWVGRGRRA
ncbi:hypothetical protein ACLIMP_22270 [Novosphingobium aerophilum]|uniref:hypothetical protein n=1 Tax=Novosphingobium aerophilum TaxID=2839843 RepID=UPI00163DC040